jgi:phosphoribosylamine--glycine ligase
MKLLVIGSGAREHALVAKLAGERAVGEIVCAPGNAGIRELARTAAVRADDPRALVELARHEDITLTIVGPEVPLSLGVVDLFRAEGRAIVGPTREAAMLETSKIFAKDFMARHDVPTAEFRSCRTLDEARAAVDAFGTPVVVKADGLAGGKGVVVAKDGAEAAEAAHAALVLGRFGEAGDRIVVERFLEGREASFFVVTDGTHAAPLASAEDHKRAFDGDQGPNTGGMGAYAPSPLVTADMADRILEEIVTPVLAGMRKEGRPFCGFLYVGLMLTADGPRVVEFNVRLGDPEAQVVLPLLEDDLLPLVAAAADGSLSSRPCRLGRQPHVGVVLASGGYPGSYDTGFPISGLDEARRLPGVEVFHAGTTLSEGRVVTSGGRVLTVVGRGDDYHAAMRTAYAGVARVSFERMHWRRDIGARALREP